MKPKKRVRQGQSARLYLRGNDHRDVIYNGAYVNNLVWSDGNGSASSNRDKVKFMWTKYPTKMLVLMPYHDGGYHYFGYVDLDRRFFHLVSYSSNTSTARVRRLKDFIVTTSTWSSSSVYVSNNGCVYLSDVTGNRPNSIDGHTAFGHRTNTLIKLYSTDNYTAGNELGVDLVTFSRNKTTGKYSTTESYKVYTLPSKFTYDFVIYCRTKNGVIWFMRYSDPDIGHLAVYEITSSGVTNIGSLYMHQGTDKISYGGVYEILYNSKGAEKLDNDNTLVLLTRTRGTDRTNGTVYFHAILAYCSKDGGATWTSKVLHIRRNDDASIPHASNVGYSLKLFERSGVFYAYVLEDVYWSDNYGLEYYKFYAWKSTDGLNWTEISFPDYMDIPYLEDAGKGVISQKNKSIRLKFNSYASSSSGDNIEMYHIIRNDRNDTSNWSVNDGANNIMMENGKIVDNPNWVALETDYYSRLSFIQCCLFFDNPELKPSDNNFAVRFGNIDGTDGKEYLLPEDYVYGN